MGEGANYKILGNVQDRLLALEDELQGLGALFQSGKREVPLTEKEMFGIGQFLRRLSAESASLCEYLRESNLLGG